MVPTPLSFIVGGIGLFILKKNFKSRRRLSKLSRMLKRYEEMYSITTNQLHAIRDEMAESIAYGLGHHDGDLHMLETYVDMLPTGEERGTFLALDIGGTNFRVLRVTFNGRAERPDVRFREIELPRALLTSHADALFDFMARAMVTFLEELGERAALHSPALAFTFSFPMQQTAINKGTLMYWSKGFACEGAEGRDPVELLEAAFQRQGFPVTVSVLLNDSLGPLMAARRESEDAVIGVIIGTGTNAAYIEKVDKITKLPPSALHRSEHMLINTEWANFRGRSLPVTEEDVYVDAASTNPGRGIFEKMISGLNLGEVARRMMLRLAEDAELFGGDVPRRFQEPGALPTKLLAAAESDVSPDLKQVRSILTEELGVPPADATRPACEALRTVSMLVMRRSAQLTAAGVLGIMRHLGRDGEGARPTVVSIDGGVYRKAAAYPGHLRAAFARGGAPRVAVVCLEEGSSIGACVTAAVCKQ